MLQFQLCLFILFFTLAASAAKPLVINMCTLDRDFRPLTLRDGSGVWQQTVKAAAKEAGLTVRFFTAPRKRCLNEIKAFTADAIFSGAVVGREKEMQFPKNDSGLFDESKAVGRPVYRVYRRKGSTVDWNGKAFLNLGKDAVGIQNGVYPMYMLKEQNVKIETTESAVQTLRQLTMSRISAAVVNEEQLPILQKEMPLDTLEPLPIPYAVEPIYLALSLEFYKNHPEEAERLWKALQKVTAKR